jgi:hypothetical protein
MRGAQSARRAGRMVNWPSLHQIDGDPDEDILRHGNRGGQDYGRQTRRNFLTTKSNLVDFDLEICRDH